MNILRFPAKQKYYFNGISKEEQNMVLVHPVTDKRFDSQDYCVLSKK